MNSTFIREQSEALAARLATIDDDDARIAGLFLSAFGRAPQAEEVTSLKEFLSEYRDAQPGTAGPGPPRELIALSRAILTSNEFFFVD
jgi:hypothetical protein